MINTIFASNFEFQGQEKHDIMQPQGSTYFINLVQNIDYVNEEIGRNYNIYESSNLSTSNIAENMDATASKEFYCLQNINGIHQSENPMIKNGPGTTSCRVNLIPSSINNPDQYYYSMFTGVNLDANFEHICNDNPNARTADLNENKERSRYDEFVKNADIKLDRNNLEFISKGDKKCFRNHFVGEISNGKLISMTSSGTTQSENRDFITHVRNNEYPENICLSLKQRFLKYKSDGNLNEIFRILEEDFNLHENRMEACEDGFIPSVNAKIVKFFCSFNFQDVGLANESFKDFITSFPTFDESDTPIRGVISEIQSVGTEAISAFQEKPSSYLSDQQMQNISGDHENPKKFCDSNFSHENLQTHINSFDEPCSSKHTHVSTNTNEHLNLNDNKLLRNGVSSDRFNKSDSSLTMTKGCTLFSTSNSFDNKLDISGKCQLKYEDVPSNINEEIPVNKNKGLKYIFRKLNSKMQRKITDIFEFNVEFSLLSNKYIDINRGKWDPWIYTDANGNPFRKVIKVSECSLNHLICEIKRKNIKNVEKISDEKYKNYLERNNERYQKIKITMEKYLKNTEKQIRYNYRLKEEIEKKLNEYGSFTKEDPSTDERLIIFAVWNNVSDFLKRTAEDNFISIFFPEMIFINELYNSNLREHKVCGRRWIPGAYLRVFLDHEFELFMSDFLQNGDGEDEFARRILGIRILYIFDLLKFLNTTKTILATYSILSLKFYYLRLDVQFDSLSERSEYEKMFKTSSKILIDNILEQVTENGSIDYQNFRI